MSKLILILLQKHLGPQTTTLASQHLVDKQTCRSIFQLCGAIYMYMLKDAKIKRYLSEPILYGGFPSFFPGPV